MFYVFKDVGSSKAISTEKGLQCPTPQTDKPQKTELTLVDRLDGTQRSLPVVFEFYAMPVVGGVAPAVVGDNDTVTVSGSNFPKGRARCRFGEQVIVESQAVWRDGLRCQVPPRHRDEDTKASRVVEVAFEGSDFLKTKTSVAHVLRPPSSSEVTQMVKVRSRTLCLYTRRLGHYFGGTPVDVKGPPGFMSNVSGGYCVFDDDVGAMEVINTLRCAAGRRPEDSLVLSRSWCAPVWSCTAASCTSIACHLRLLRSNRPSARWSEALLFYLEFLSSALLTTRDATSAKPGRTLV